MQENGTMMMIIMNDKDDFMMFFGYDVNIKNVFEFYRHDEDFYLYEYDESIKSIDSFFKKLYADLTKTNNTRTNIETVIKTYGFDEEKQNRCRVYMYELLDSYVNPKYYDKDEKYINEFNDALTDEKTFRKFIIKKYEDTYIDNDSCMGATIIKFGDNDKFDVVASSKQKIIFIDSISAYKDEIYRIRHNSETYKKYFSERVE